MSEKLSNKDMGDQSINGSNTRAMAVSREAAHKELEISYEEAYKMSNSELLEALDAKKAEEAEKAKAAKSIENEAIYSEQDMIEARSELVDLVNDGEFGQDTDVTVLAKLTDKQIVSLIEKYTDPNYQHDTTHLAAALKEVLGQKEDGEKTTPEVNGTDDSSDLEKSGEAGDEGDETAVTLVTNPETTQEQPAVDGEQKDSFKDRLLKSTLVAKAHNKWIDVSSGLAASEFAKKWKERSENSKEKGNNGRYFLYGFLAAAGITGTAMIVSKLGGVGGDEIVDQFGGGASGPTGASGTTGEADPTPGQEQSAPFDPSFGADIDKESSSSNEFASHYSDKNHSDNKVNAWGTERGIENAEYGTFKGETLKDYLDTHSQITAGNVEVLVNARFQEKYGLDADTFNSEWGQNKREEMKREYISDSGHSLSEAGQRAHKYHIQELSEGKVVKMTADEAASKYGLTVNSYMTEGDLKGGIDDIATATGGVVGTVLVTLDENGKPKFAEKAACGNNVFIGNPDASTPQGGTPGEFTPDADLDGPGGGTPPGGEDEPNEEKEEVYVDDNGEADNGDVRADGPGKDETKKPADGQNTDQANDQSGGGTGGSTLPAQGSEQTPKPGEASQGASGETGNSNVTED